MRPRHRRRRHGARAAATGDAAISTTPAPERALVEIVRCVRRRPRRRRRDGRRPRRRRLQPRRRRLARGLRSSCATSSASASGFGDEPVIVNDAVGRASLRHRRLGRRRGRARHLLRRRGRGTPTASSSISASGPTRQARTCSARRRSPRSGGTCSVSAPQTSLLDRALERWHCADADELLYAFTRIGGLPESGAGPVRRRRSRRGGGG